MKRFAKSVLGVTLLEIMLVLAIAAMVIVMSVRYYQSATASEQANATLELIQAVTAAADSLAQATGSYAAISTTQLTSILPNGSNALVTAWGGSLALSGWGASSYTATLSSVPTQVCPLISTRISTNNHFTALGTCGTAASFAYTYVANP